MTAKELIVGSTIVLGAAITASSITLAQAYYGYHHRYHHHWYGHHRGLYNYYGGTVARRDVDRGGPGPRVGAGSGTGIGAVR